MAYMKVSIGFGREAGPDDGAAFLQVGRGKLRGVFVPGGDRTTDKLVGVGDTGLGHGCGEARVREVKLGEKSETHGR